MRRRDELWRYMNILYMGNDDYRWVAIDIGSAEIKASVLGGSNNPCRLPYVVGGDYFTRMTMEAYLAADGHVIVGNDALFCGMADPQNSIFDWIFPTADVGKRERNRRVAEMFLSTIRDSAARHYGIAPEKMAAVLLYDDEEGIRKMSDVLSIAREVFNRVEQLAAYEAVIDDLFPDAGSSVLVADLGASSLKIFVAGRTAGSNQLERKCHDVTPELGFANVELPQLADLMPESESEASKSLYAVMTERLRSALLNGDKTVFPPQAMRRLSSSEGDFRQTAVKGFDRNMTLWLGRCLDECASSLKSINESWDAISGVVLMGGGAHSHVLGHACDLYMKSQGYVSKPYNCTHPEFDAQYVAAHCALRIISSRYKKVKVIF